MISGTVYLHLVFILACTINTFKKHVSVELKPETVNWILYFYYDSIGYGCACGVPTQATGVADIDGIGEYGGSF